MQTKQFDQYDITELMGLTLTPEQKSDLFKEYYTLILNRFFTQKLQDIISPSEQPQILSILSSSTPDETKLELLSKSIPHLEEVLTVFSIEQKKTLLKEHYERMLKDCENLYASTLTKENKEALSQRYDHYARAITLLEKEAWDDLNIHMHSSFSV